MPWIRSICWPVEAGRVRGKRGGDVGVSWIWLESIQRLSCAGGGERMRGCHLLGNDIASRTRIPCRWEDSRYRRCVGRNWLRDWLRDWLRNWTGREMGRERRERERVDIDRSMEGSSGWGWGNQEDKYSHAVEQTIDVRVNPPRNQLFELIIIYWIDLNLFFFFYNSYYFFSVHMNKDIVMTHQDSQIGKNV